MRKFRWWLLLFGLAGLCFWAAVSLFPPPEGFGSSASRISTEIDAVSDSLSALDFRINEASRADQGELGLISLDSIKLLQEILWQKQDSLKDVWKKSPPREGWVGAWEWMYRNADHRFAFYGCGGIFGISILLGLILLMLPPGKNQKPDVPTALKNKAKPVVPDVPTPFVAKPNQDAQSALKDALSGLSQIVKKSHEDEQSPQLTRKIPLDFGKPIPIDQIRMPKWESLTEGPQVQNVVDQDKPSESIVRGDDVIDIQPVTNTKQSFFNSPNIADDSEDANDSSPLLTPTTSEDIHGTVFRMHRKGRSSREIARLLRISIEEVDMMIKTLPPV